MNSDLTSEATPGIEERIRARAYQLWIEEGRPHGRDQEHWDKARQQIEEEERQSAPEPAASPTLSDGGASIDPPVKTKTAAKKKRSLKAAKAPRHS